MKYICEICGCTADNVDTMREHEKRCKVKYENQIYCNEQLNILINLANTFTFGLVAEIPGEKEPQFYKITAAELDDKKNRCVLKVQNDDSTPTTETKASRRK